MEKTLLSHWILFFYNTLTYHCYCCYKLNDFRLSDHVKDKSKLPILIFPEGKLNSFSEMIIDMKGKLGKNSTFFPMYTTIQNFGVFKVLM